MQFQVSKVLSSAHLDDTIFFPVNNEFFQLQLKRYFYVEILDIIGAEASELLEGVDFCEGLILGHWNICSKLLSTKKE